MTVGDILKHCFDPEVIDIYRIGKGNKVDFELIINDPLVGHKENAQRVNIEQARALPVSDMIVDSITTSYFHVPYDEDCTGISITVR